MKNIFVYLLFFIVIVLFVMTVVFVAENRELEEEISILLRDNEEILFDLLESEKDNLKLTEELLELENKYTELDEKFIQINEKLKKMEESKPKQPSRSSLGRSRTFSASAYVDDVESQGKWVGKTATGIRLEGMTLESKLIAVDPSVIPLGSTVFIEFPEPYKHLNGNYKAVDVGGDIKGNRIDVFFGPAEERSKAFEFGRRDVQISW